MKANNASAREAAFTFLVTIGEALPRWHQVKTEGLLCEFHRKFYFSAGPGYRWYFPWFYEGHPGRFSWKSSAHWMHNSFFYWVKICFDVSIGIYFYRPFYLKDLLSVSRPFPWWSCWAFAREYEFTCDRSISWSSRRCTEIFEGYFSQKKLPLILLWIYDLSIG